MSKVTLKNVNLGYKINRKEYNNVIDDLNMVIESEKISVIIGESGSGKTTIIRAIAGILKVDKGNIYFDDIDVTDYDSTSRNVSYVSQMIGLYPNFTVFNNIAFPLKISHTPAEEIRERVYEVADMLKIAHCLTRKPRQLSIGQAQRVAIARAIVKRSNVYLFDEPFSNLDKDLSRELTLELKKLLTSLRATVIFISHDLNEALSIADHVFVLKEGKVIFSDEPQKLIKSKDKDIVKLLEASR